MILRLRAAHPDGATVRATMNGGEVSTCKLPPGTWVDCRLSVTSAQTREGLNELTLASDTVGAADQQRDPRELAFEMQTGRVRVGR